MTKEHPVALHEQMIADLQNKCEGHEERISLLEKNDIRAQEQTKQLYQTVGRIEQMVSDIKRSLDIMANTVDEKLEKAVTQLSLSLEKLDTRIVVLEHANGKKWEKLVWAVMAGAITLIGTLIIQGVTK